MTESDYTEMVEALSKITLADGSTANVSLVDSAGQFRDVYDIISDIANVWDKMDANSKSGLAEKLAGTRQQDVFFSLINNFNDTKQAMDDMANSAGNMQEAYDTYLNSTEAHVNSFKAAMTGLGADIFQADRMNAVVDVGRAIINVIDGIVKAINALGGVKTILISVIAGFALFKSQNVAETVAASLGKLVGILPKIATSFSSMGSAVAGAVPSLMAAKTGTEAFAAILPMLGVGLAGVSLVVGAISLVAEQEAEAMRKATEAARENYEASSNLSSSYETILRYADSGELATSSDNELADAISNVSEALGGKYDSLQDVIAAQDEYIEKVREAAKEESANLARSSSILMGAEETNIRSAFKDINTNTIGYLGQKYDSDAYSIAKNVFDKISGINAQGDNADFKDIISAYYELIYVRNQLADQGIVTGDTVDALSGTISSAKESVESYTNAMYDNLKATHESNNGVVDTISEYNQLKDSIDDYINNNLGGNGSIKEVMLSKLRSEFSGVLDIAAADAVENSGEKTDEAVRGFVKKIRMSLEAQSESYSDIAKDEINSVMDAYDQLSDEMKSSVYASSYDEGGTFLGYGNFKKQIEGAQFSYEDLMAEKGKDDAPSFADKVSEYTSQIDKLKSAYDSLKKGELDDSAIRDLEIAFPSLTGKTDSLGDAIMNLAAELTGGMNEFGEFDGIIGEFQDQFGRLSTEEDRTQLQELLNTITELAEGIGSFNFDIDVEQNGFTALMNALKESASITGASENSILALTERFKGLSGMDDELSSLFEKTNLGIRVNQEALTKLENKYEEVTQNNIDSKLAELSDSYVDLSLQINECNNASDLSILNARRDAIAKEIENVSVLGSQYEALSSDYMKWQESLNTAEEGDMYDKYVANMEDVQERYKAGLVGTEKFRSAVQLMTDKDISGMNADQVEREYEKQKSVMEKYFKNTERGVDNFAKALNEANSKWAHRGKNGGWVLEFEAEDLDDISKAVGISTDAIDLIIKKMHDYGYEVEMTSKYSDALTEAQKAADNAIKRQNDSKQGRANRKARGYDYDLTSTNKLDLDNQINDAIGEYNKAKAALTKAFKDGATSEEIKVKTDEVQDAELVVRALIGQYQSLDEPVIMSVDASQIDNVDISGLISNLQEMYNLCNEREIQIREGASTEETDQKIQSISKTLLGIPEEVYTTIGLKKDDMSGILNGISGTDISANVTFNENIISNLKSQIQSVDDDDIKLVVDTSQASRQVKILSDDINNLPSSKQFTLNTYGLTTLQLLKRTQDQIGGEKTLTVRTQYVTSGRPRNTTGLQEYHKGTVGDVLSSFAKGTNLKYNAIAGELGEELLVRDGKAYMLGVGSAQFFDYKRGDLIFNADQTEQLKKTGKITSGQTRAMAYANGTGLPVASAFYKATSSGGKVSDYEYNSNKSSVKNNADSGSKRKSSSSSKTSSSKDDKDKKKKEKETDEALDKFKEWLEKFVDWVEVKVARRLEKVTKKLREAERYLDRKSYDSAAKSYRSVISGTASQAQLNKDASAEYKDMANSVLSKAKSEGIISSKAATSIKKKIKDGTLDIRQYSERQREVISNYKEWYDKAKECSDQIQELHDNIRQYISDLKDLRDAQRDNRIERIETFGTMTNSGFAPTSGSSSSFANLQLRRENVLLDKKSDTYLKAEMKNKADSRKLGNSAIKSFQKSIKSTSNKTYRNALKDAERLIKAKKKVPSSIANIIKKNSRSQYEKVYAYNLSLENIETARLEYLVEKAANIGTKYNNIAQVYENKDTATQNRISLLESQSENARLLKNQNKYLNQAVRAQDQILSNDRAEIKEVNDSVKKYAKRIRNTKNNKNFSYRGAGFSNANEKTREKVKALVKKIRDRVKARKAITPTQLSNVANYVAKGVMSERFFNYCFNYNEALNHKIEAEAIYEIDKQTAKAYKEQAREQMRSNIQDKISERQERYDKQREDVSQQLSLYEAKSDNARTLSGKNDYVRKAVSQREELLKIDKKEANKFKSLRDDNASRVTSNKNNYGNKYSKASDKKRKEVDNFVAKIKETVKSGKRISDDDMRQLGTYYDGQYINNAFLQACMSYNEYYDIEKQARDSYELEKEALKAYKKQAREQIASNIRDSISESQDEYNKIDDEYSRKISLYEAQADNAKSASEKNELIKKAIEQQDGIIDNDIKELEDFTNKTRKSADEIVNENGSAHGKKYSSASETKRKKADDLIEKIKSDVKSGNRIKDKDLEDLGYYVDDGIVGDSFYDSCVYYNYYYDAKKEASDQYEIDKETVKSYKETAAINSVKNIENEHNNVLNTNERKRSLAESKQRLKQTRGNDLTLEDYQELSSITAEREQLLNKEKQALRAEMDAQLQSGNWTEDSQGYIDALDKLSEIDEEIIDCKISQEEYNNAIANLPLEKLEKELQLLDAIESNIESINKLADDSGKDLTTADYNKQINAINDRIRALNGLKNEARLGYQQALASEDGTYGGKTADEWQKEVYDYDTQINNLNDDIVNLKKEMRDDVLWRPFRRAHDECERFATVLEGVGNLIDDEMVFDSNGNMTDFGAAKIANLAKQYENARKEVQNYSNDLSELEKLKAQGEYEDIDEYNEKLNELKSNLLNSASTMKGSIDAIINIYKEQGQKELDAVFKLIDARKEALDKKKAWIITCFLC